ncbi:MAG: PspC domain-containing protein [Defluviitaleaceae bacterium]|nr:PspC domain-containing protein [Defluviitaleaceae bacterium]
MQQKKLYKARRDTKIDGVCKGLADYFAMDPTMMRIIWIVAGLFLHIGLVIAYIICSLVMPREPEYHDSM